jgi:hypothetical protein
VGELNISKRLSDSHQQIEAPLMKNGRFGNPPESELSSPLDFWKENVWENYERYICLSNRI